MSLSQIRNSIEALERKLAVPLAVVRLQPLAEEFCDEWNVAHSDHKPLPESHPFIQRIAGRGFRLNTFMALRNYIERCRERKEFPQPRQIVNALLPQAAVLGFVQARFSSDAPAMT